MSRHADPLAVSLGRFRPAALALGTLIAAFLLLPIAIIVPTSFTGGDYLGFPPDGLSTRWYSEIASDPVWTGALVTSLVWAIAAAALATVTGTLAALGARRVGRRGGWLRTVFVAPIVLPYVVYAVGLYDAFDRMRLIGSAWPVILGQSVLAFPLVFVAVSAGLARIDPALLRAAASLGAPWWVTVLRIELRLAWASIAAAALFALAFCFDEVVLAFFLTTPENQTLPVQIFRSARDSASPAIAAASAVVMLLAVVVIGLGALLVRLSSRSREVAS